MAKIAILSIYSGVVERGAETFVFEIANRLSQKHQIYVFQSGYKKNNDQKYKIIPIKNIAKPPKSLKGFLGKANLDFQSLRILLFTLKALPNFFKNKYDVIIPMNGGWQTVIMRTVSKLTRSKIIIVGQAGIGASDAWNLFFRPDVFVALTSAQLKWAKKLSPEVRLELIPNGVDVTKFNPKIPPAGVALPKPIVVCTSGLDPYKRVDLTIKAVAKTKNLSLLVLGDGELRGQIDSLGKRLLGKRYLRMVVPYEKMASYLRTARVFTLVSQTEAFGTAYVEAMACNLPVVATSDESRQEIIQRAGILTEARNVEKYARDLEIAEKSNYRNIPYDRALNFSWNKISKKYDSLITFLVSK